MNKTVKVIFGVCIVLILAAGAFFAGSTYYGSKQKDAQLASMKRESSAKESKYLSSKNKVKQETKKSKVSSSSAIATSNTTNVASSETQSESSSISTKPAQRLDEETARSLIAQAGYGDADLTLMPTDDGKYHFQKNDTDTFMVVEPDNFNAWTEAYVDEQDSDGNIITTHHFTND